MFELVKKWNRKKFNKNSFTDLVVFKSFCDYSCFISEGQKNMLTNKILDMPDDLNKRESQDLSSINLNEIWELEFWMKKLKVTKEKLKEAVKAVGTSVAAVRKYLQK